MAVWSCRVTVCVLFLSCMIHNAQAVSVNEFTTLPTGTTTQKVTTVTKRKETTSVKEDKQPVYISFSDEELEDENNEETDTFSFRDMPEELLKLPLERDERELDEDDFSGSGSELLEETTRSTLTTTETKTTETATSIFTETTAEASTSTRTTEETATGSRQERTVRFALDLDCNTASEV